MRMILAPSAGFIPSALSFLLFQRGSGFAQAAEYLLKKDAKRHLYEQSIVQY